MRSAISKFPRTLLRSSNFSASLRPAQTCQVRYLNVHEYNAFDIMKDHGVSVPKGIMCETPSAVADAYNSGSLGGPEIVVKAQALTGGRGRGHFDNGFQGGVKIVGSADEAKEVAGNMIGQKLITKQTGEEGKPVNKVYLMEKLNIDKEAYFSILFDRAAQGPVLVGSPAGGMAIEDVAAETPEKIFTTKVDIEEGVTSSQAAELAKNMGFEGAAQKECEDVIKGLYDLFIKTDATLVEINPLAQTKEGNVFCSDCKLNFDDNAKFRQEPIHELRDVTQEDSREVEAAKFDLNYIGLDGSIGCLVNGAGLAMATMDIIKLYGGSPANFLDVGGGATEDQVEKAFAILNADPKVKAILVNIFGGIMRCDIIAAGVVAAAKTIGLDKPLVVRLQGTNVELAKEIIANSGVEMTMLDDLDEAASRAVALGAEN
eukprot:maker-scaffold_4-snap-gene-19.3-mRNA-1 protein AED:0.01 eAED:0.01 QI:192/1/1/1/1/1/3/174/429